MCDIKLTEEVRAALTAYHQQNQGCVIDAATALRPELAGLRLFDPLLSGVAAADDPGFTRLKQAEIAGEAALTPTEWLPGAKSVLSFFLPFSATVREAHLAEAPDDVAAEWLHGRIQGQEYGEQLSRWLVAWLESRGYQALTPILDPRFRIRRDDNAEPVFSSAWSERHAAYLCGLGTFSLTKALITARGLCGRFGSVVTTAPLAPSGRDYDRVYEYCIRCGACISRCPAGAISLEQGKDHLICSAYQDMLRKKFPQPYYGCGKCQVGVPCEKGRP